MSWRKNKRVRDVVAQGEQVEGDVRKSFISWLNAPLHTLEQ